MKGETGGGHSQPQNHHLQQQPHIPYSGHGIVDSKKRRTEVLGMKGAQSRGLYDKLCVPVLGERKDKPLHTGADILYASPFPDQLSPDIDPACPFYLRQFQGKGTALFRQLQNQAVCTLCSPLIPPHLSIFSYCRSYTGRFLRSVKRVRSQKQIGIELPSRNKIPVWILLHIPQRQLQSSQFRLLSPHRVFIICIVKNKYE